VDELNALVSRAREGDLDAVGRLVRATQTMAFAVSRSVLRDSGVAQDAVQEAYLTAFRRLGDLGDPGAFLSWLRRIVITTAINARRARRLTLLQLDDAFDVPVLDEAETSWTELQRHRLAGALHRVDEGRILRYDLTLPLLMTVRFDGRPLRIFTAGNDARKIDVSRVA
jgi:DNA-directed RNA polymerase specialized sigma24 family protein